MIQKTLNILTSLLIICFCILGCNTEQFRPKPNKPNKPTVPQTVKEEPKPKTAAEEQADEEIGAASLSYGDLDESGDGIYGRKLSASFFEKVETIKKEADPSHKGVLKIIACIDPLGSILMARPDIKQTTMNDLDLQRKVGRLLIDERYEADAAAPDRQCGHIIVEF